LSALALYPDMEVRRNSPPVLRIGVRFVNDLDLHAIRIGIECRVVTVAISGLALVVCGRVQDFCASRQHGGMNLIHFRSRFRMESDMVRSPGSCWYGRPSDQLDQVGL
jgi:hypothetical protein